MDKMQRFTQETTVAQVTADPAFKDFGRLLFPVDLSIPGTMTLKQLSSSQVYLWYSHIKTEKTLDILNTLRERSLKGERIFFPIYGEAEMASDPSKKQTGLFFFRGEPGRVFAVMNAGGGFYYVGAMHDSFPHALEVSRKGYNAFALIYRVEKPLEDLAQAILWIYDHAEELSVRPEGYSLWGGSAGARMAAILGNRRYLAQLTGRRDIPQAAAVIMQYTGYGEVSREDASVYTCVRSRDGIAYWKTMERRLGALEALGIPTEFYACPGLGHGFGLGTGTAAEGWLDDAVAFWERQMQ